MLSPFNTVHFTVLDNHVLKSFQYNIIELYSCIKEFEGNGVHCQRVKCWQT